MSARHVLTVGVLFGSFALGISLTCVARAAEGELADAVSAAIEQLASQESYTWTETVEADGGPGGSATEGTWQRDGHLRVTSSGGGGVDIVRLGEHAAAYINGVWQAVGQQVADGRQGGRRGRGGRGGNLLQAATQAELPTAQAKRLLEQAASLRAEGDQYVGELTSEQAQALMPPAGRGGRRGRRGRGGPPPVPPQVSGQVTFWLDNGLLSKYAVALTSTTVVSGEERSVTRTETTTISDVNATEVDVPLYAGRILAALVAGTEPPDYSDERGFELLFNGKDLTGWAGRPEHWSVEDGAIVGRTTAENPARGNNFLFAKRGEENLLVDDFELRLSYRITANNDAGFANSGIQYRSQDRGDFVVAGYQADMEAADRYSGILYDEAGGAGGRRIMAERGEKVVWTADGEKTVVGRLGDAAELQGAIKKDDWNDYVIIARGNHLQHFINGVQMIDVVDDSASQRLASGVLALQIHSGEPMTVSFKDIRIKSLSAPAETAASNLKVKEGFRVEQVYLVPRESQGSWVAMCVDDRGRLIVSDQSGNGRLYRLTPPPVGSSLPIEPEPIDLDIGGAHGLLYAFDSLYVAVNERGDRNGLYRVRDTDGDDKFDSVELLKLIDASGEHGLHAILLAPDGESLYVVCGDQNNFREFDSSRVPLHWSEDHLLPRMWDGNGFMRGVLGPGGWIARINPDATSWELISVGFRNEYDAAFNREGELFTYDADMEWDLNTPWYRPTRLNHVQSGSEFGWRSGAGKWPDYYIDSLGSVLDIGPGSPTGVSFGYGAKFPAKYQDALYVCDWSFGKLYAAHLTPQGASYTAELEDFLTGQPLPLTDMVISPHDGAMYITLGGRGTQSALYRVTYVGDESTEPSQGEAALADQRALRRRLEAFHGHRDPEAVDTVWPYLSDSDRALRYAARIALEWQDPDAWRERTLTEENPRAAIAALVALARVSSQDEFHRQPSDPAPDLALQGSILAALGRIDWQAISEQDRIDLLRAYTLAFTRFAPPSEAVRAELAARFEPLFPAATRELNAELAQMLVYVQAPGTAQKLMAALREAPSQPEQIEYLRALRVLRTGWTMPLREEYFRWFLTAASFEGGSSLGGSMRAMKDDALALLSEEESQALASIINAVPTTVSFQQQLAERPLVKEWTLDELVQVVERGLAGGRSFEQGRRLFGVAQCARCHRFDGDGNATGPDLTSVAGRFSVRDLLESIVEPNKAISDQYAAINILLKSGSVVTGRVGNLRSDTLDVIQDMSAPGDMTRVNRQDIEEIRTSTVSIMPSGMLNTFHEEEIQDLMAYLLSRGDPGGEAFR